MHLRPTSQLPTISCSQQATLRRSDRPGAQPLLGMTVKAETASGQLVLPPHFPPNPSPLDENGRADDRTEIFHQVRRGHQLDLPFLRLSGKHLNVRRRQTKRFLESACEGRRMAEAEFEG